MEDMANDFKILREVLKGIKDKQQKERMEYAINIFEKHKISFKIVNESEINILYKNNNIKFFPRTGWHTGKGIKDGRGIKKLLGQMVTKLDKG